MGGAPLQRCIASHLKISALAAEVIDALVDPSYPRNPGKSVGGFVPYHAPLCPASYPVGLHFGKIMSREARGLVSLGPSASPLRGNGSLFDNRKLPTSIPESGQQHPEAGQNWRAKSNAETWIRINHLESMTLKQFPPKPLILKSRDNSIFVQNYCKNCTKNAITCTYLIEPRPQQSSRSTAESVAPHSLDTASRPP